MNNRFGSSVLSILSLAMLWEIAGRAMDSTLIPPLSQIAAAWWKLFSSGKLLANLSMSLTTLAVGFLLAVVVGVILGLLMGRFRAVEHFLDLYVNALMSAQAWKLITYHRLAGQRERTPAANSANTSALATPKAPSCA